MHLGWLKQKTVCLKKTWLVGCVCVFFLILRGGNWRRGRLWNGWKIDEHENCLCVFPYIEISCLREVGQLVLWPAAVSVLCFCSIFHRRIEATAVLQTTDQARFFFGNLWRSQMWNISWTSKGTPPMPPPQEISRLIRVLLTTIIDPLIRPAIKAGYFLGGGFGGYPWIPWLVSWFLLMPQKSQRSPWAGFPESPVGRGVFFWIFHWLRQVT